jgi:hypothetical protein
MGAEVRLFGSDFDQAKEEARRFAEYTRARFIEDGREPEIAEGAGTIGLSSGARPSGLKLFLFRWETGPLSQESGDG